MELQVNQWGNSLAIRIPAALAKSMHLTKGSKLNCGLLTGNKAVLELSNPTPPGQTLADILARAKPMRSKMPLAEPIANVLRAESRY
jgi:antitoxin component of MazEF toxin-antitoxin module